MRSMWICKLFMAARFCIAEAKGSYTRETTSMNRKKVSRSIALRASSTLPTSATVAMPSFKIICAGTTNSAVPSSLLMCRPSARSILANSPSRYRPSALLLFKSRTASRSSWMPSITATSASFWRRVKWFCTFLEAPTMSRAAGSTHSAASAIRQSNTNIPTATMQAEMMEP